jgi:hypothetical protein
LEWSYGRVQLMNYRDCYLHLLSRLEGADLQGTVLALGWAMAKLRNIWYCRGSNVGD